MLPCNFMINPGLAASYYSTPASPRDPLFHSERLGLKSVLCYGSLLSGLGLVSEPNLLYGVVEKIN